MSITPPLPTLRLPEVPPGPGPDAAARSAQARPGGVPVPPASALPNPSLRLDASLGLVVLEFRDADGTARTIPNERELAAYRSAARGHGAGHPGVPQGTPEA